MAFEFKSGEKQHPSKFGGSPHKALLAEILDFSKQHRKHSLRRFAGMDPDEPASPSEAVGKSVEECEACAKGDCDNPEHMNEDERGKLASMLGENERDDDHDYSE